MLGTILGGLTDAAVAEQVLASFADTGLLGRVRDAADQTSMTPGHYVASTVRRVLDHANEEFWLDLAGRMAQAPQPGAAALQIILTRALAPADASACPNHGAAGHTHHGPAGHAHHGHPVS